MIPPDFLTWLTTPRRRPLVMGVLNVTPDSFSDGGRFVDPDAAAEHAQQMVADGADLIDVGGESTRPGADPVSEAEQIARVVPVISALGKLPVTISIDTTSAAVAEAALSVGAAVVNDISAGRMHYPSMYSLCARTGAPLVLMHIKGNPKTMQKMAVYNDVVDEVRRFLVRRAGQAERVGVDPSRILLDVGIGFAKTTAHNLALLRQLEIFTALPYPHLVGVSRKRFLGDLTGEPVAANRTFGTAAAVAWSVAHGASIVRVHDVHAMRQVVDVTTAIASA